MKLHLGCGHLYLPAAVNIDKHDLCVADVQADVIRLPIKRKSCSTVVTYHVIEHLGYWRNKFSDESLSLMTVTLD